MMHVSNKFEDIIPAHSFVLLGLLFFIGCANPIPPTGGPKDSTPPALITEESTPNFVTSFDQKEIILTFDEWIQLKDPFQQIVISPPLVKRPDIKVKGKSIRIVFDANEVLRPQTTYTINFGASIIDLAESNPLDQFQYIFSTGLFIDSLSISGTLVQSSDGMPAKDVLILLNENLSDTAFLKTTPTYFTKSDASGKWRINYIRSDTFKLYALKDLNANYKYDQPGEEIGFQNELIVLPDTSATSHKLTLFAEDLPPIVLGVNRKIPGVTKVNLTTPGKEIHVSSLTPDQQITWHAINDTVIIWHAGTDSTTLVINEGLTNLDTIRISGYPGQGAPPVVITSQSKTLHPTKPLVLQSKTPVQTVVPDLFYAILNDSIIVSDLRVWIDSLDDRSIYVSHKWEEKGNYQLVAPEGSITDLFGTQNDSTLLRFQVSAAGNFGQIFLKVNGLADSVHYLVQLLQQNGTVLDQFVLSDVSEGTGRFGPLSPQTYLIRIVEDLNANKRRDTGIFAQHRQPERVQTETLEPLRAGWDLEATVIWKEQQH
jgi:hypothetical protein